MAGVPILKQPQMLMDNNKMGEWNSNSKENWNGRKVKTWLCPLSILKIYQAAVERWLGTFSYYDCGYSGDGDGDPDEDEDDNDSGDGKDEEDEDEG